MHRFTEVVPGSSDGHTEAVLTLSFRDRRRSRLRTRLDDGREIALHLPRGTILRDGDRLRAEAGGAMILVRAAAQTLSRVHTADNLRLARAAYHLGNRHVPVQVGPGWLAYEHDHVLDGMVAELGLRVETETAPFEPEAGGYRHGEGRGHAHPDADAHDHHDADAHDHGPVPDHHDGHEHGHGSAQGDRRHEP
jgi:urease accessory protein